MTVGGILGHAMCTGACDGWGLGRGMQHAQATTCMGKFGDGEGRTPPHPIPRCTTSAGAAALGARHHAEHSTVRAATVSFDEPLYPHVERRTALIDLQARLCWAASTSLSTSTNAWWRTCESRTPSPRRASAILPLWRAAAHAGVLGRVQAVLVPQDMPARLLTRRRPLPPCPSSPPQRRHALPHLRPALHLLWSARVMQRRGSLQTVRRRRKRVRLRPPLRAPAPRDPSCHPPRARPPGHVCPGPR